MVGLSPRESSQAVETKRISKEALAPKELKEEWSNYQKEQKDS